ncbi:MAG TPA: class I SAM-dependent methyltransferase [Dehalococcoidia bacterium]|jgi:ubiquinone/menaquinone biosynthesis C-methylase UbiE
MTNANEYKDAQRQMWDRLSPAWDRDDNWFQRQTHTVGEWLCRVADLRSGQRILDLACGSGQPALTAARLVRPGGTVVATDLSEEMVRVARRKANMADLDNVEFKVMDAENIDFPDETFDAVTCRWGLMFCPDPAKAVKEVHRVLKQHRPFATTTFTAADQNPWFAQSLQVAADALGVPPPPPEAPTPLRLNDTSRLKAMLADAGFQNIEIETRSFAWEFASPEESWTITSSLTPMFANAMATLDEAGKADLKARWLDVCGRYRAGSKVSFPSLAIGAYGQK